MKTEREAKVYNDWVPCELHTHTIHSDAEHTLLEMAQASVDLGVKCLALTDHNTTSGLMEKNQVERQTSIHIMGGIELTTFYGHILALGIDSNQCIEWRDLNPHTVDRAIERIHKAGGLMGVAHPFVPADPITIGCRWDFIVKDWSSVDYLEVWNDENPAASESNKQAMELWDELLSKGIQITAMSGRDWHVSSNNKKHGVVAAAYIRLPEEKKEWIPTMKQAIRKGKVSISTGKIVDFYVGSPDQPVKASMGDVYPYIKDDVLHFTVMLEPSKLKQELAVQNEKLRIVSNQGVLFDSDTSSVKHEYEVAKTISGLQWARAELYDARNDGDVLIGFTNCIYFIS